MAAQKAAAQYCAAISGGGAAITKISIFNTSLFNSSGAAPGPNHYSSYPVSANTTAVLVQGTTYHLVTSFASSSVAAMWMDYNNNGVYESAEWTPVAQNLSAASISFTIPANAVTGQTGLRIRTAAPNNYISPGDACSSFATGETEDYTVSIAALFPCSGIPSCDPISGPASVCPNQPFFLMDSAYTVGAGITMQWESSPQGLNLWSMIPGATNDWFTSFTGITAPMDYRIVVTCANAGAPCISNTFSVFINPSAQCYCSPIFPAGIKPITLVDFAGFNNGSSDTSLVSYEDFTTVTGTVVQGQSHPIIIKGNTGGNNTDSVTVYIDWNKNQQFTEAGEAYFIGVITNSTGLDTVQLAGIISVPTNASPGNTRMRVMKKQITAAAPCNTTGSGQAEDYTVNINSPVSCSGTPGGGTITGPSNICPNNNFLLYLTATTTASGTVVQWQRNTGSGWQDIPGATNYNYLDSAGITVPTSYRAVVTCSLNGLSDTSSIAAVAVSALSGCYCIPVSGGNAYISKVRILNTTLDNSSVAAPAPGHYISYPASGNTTASLMKGAAYSLSTSFSHESTVSFWIDYNQNGTFETTERMHAYNGSFSENIPFNVPAAALSGQTAMRVRINSLDPCAYSNTSETEDYLITIVPEVPCQGIPVAGTADAFPQPVCPGRAFNLGLNGTTTGSDISFQWQRFNAANLQWTNISGATTAAHHIYPGILSPTMYRAVVSCTNSSLSDTSNIDTVTFAPSIPCYCNYSTQYAAPVTKPVQMVKIGCLTNFSSAVSNFSWEDFSSLSCPGGGYPTLPDSIFVKGNTSGGNEFFNVYVDWNQNGFFTEMGESYQIGSVYDAGDTTIAAYIAPPPGALTGNTRLRVIKAPGNYPLPCNNAAFGQAEDYTITVLPLAVNSIVKKDLVCFPNPVQEVLNVQLPSTARHYGILTLTDLTGRILKQIEASNQDMHIDLADLTPGVYLLLYSNDKTRKVHVICKQ